MRTPDWEAHKRNGRFVLARRERERRNMPEVRVHHPNYGSVIVRAVGNYDAVCEAAKAWGVDYLRIRGARVLAVEREDG